MPSRFGSPRGSVPRILREAGEVADARLRSVQKYLDDFTATDDPADQVGGGTRLSRGDFVALLHQSPDFQQQIANRWVFATPREREALLTVLRQAFPQEMARAVAGVPEAPIPPEQQGTGMGGPPQGAGPLGPQPGLGAAPTVPPVAAPTPGGAPPPPVPTEPAGPTLGTSPLPSPTVTLPPPGLPLGAATSPMPPAPGVQPTGMPVGPGGEPLPLLGPVPPVGPNALPASTPSIAPAVPGGPQPRPSRAAALL